MTEAQMLIGSLEVATESGEALGYSGELLVPKWFAKNPSSSIEDDNRDLIRAVRNAFDAMQANGEGTAFEHWLAAQTRLVESAGDATPRLVAMFGVSFVERALIDAACRASGASFSKGLAGDLFGIRLGVIEPRLDGWTSAGLGRPSPSVRVRHTVGLVDALEPNEVDPAHQLGDDHPLSLVDDIAAYGLDCFKLKVSGNAEADLHRLETIARLTPDGASFTVDGNEQYAEPGELADVLDELEQRGTAPSILSGLLAIEQPVARTRTFDPDAAGGIARLAERAPVIIDEADADLASYPRARALGYRGVSMKACKGVFRALLNRARIDADGEGIQSAEDLTNLPVLPLHQDLAVVAALGLPHVERNGHHYFRGTPHLVEEERAHLRAAHRTLYRDLDAGADVALRIEGGRVDLSSLQCAGLGYGGVIDSGCGDEVTAHSPSLPDSPQETA